ncbi:unnamed protein product [Darwinula stevensoni]|uniref:Uncharacterized protein n=1 Tax=Darwinula stevensoni TaxID=69355 RepID=A0A7R8XCA6_9CRUS|nr:unnamed protein product [Darwinula stevensoni]CAG0892362.1 unnamed protein product [Darwinula stevensoni]
MLVARTLWMSHTEIEDLPDGVFGNVSFQEMRLEGNRNLRRIHPNALLPSKDRLEILIMTTCHLIDFPFEIIPELKALKELHLNWNYLTNVPMINSNSLEKLILWGNQITYLEDQSGWSMPNLKAFYLGENTFLMELPLMLVVTMQNLTRMELHGNQFGPELPERFLEFNSPALQFLALHVNSISSLEPGAITGLVPDTFINLGQNVIEELHEASFRPMVEILAQGTGSLDLHGNPLSCWCDLAWLVTNEVLRPKVTGTCKSGTRLEDLDPQFFEDLCFPENKGDESDISL